MNDTRLEVLLATINQTDDSVLEAMKVKTDILVCNQNANSFSSSSYSKNGHHVFWLNFPEKGVGLNRNNALMRSKADICLLADDDVIFFDDYEKIILTAFHENPKADVILFNIVSEDKPRFVAKKTMRVRRANCGRFGAVRIAFRRSSIIKKRICFSLLFGGGAEFSAGEDTEFLLDCIKNGLRVIAVPRTILKLDQKSESTWFAGYNDKFFFDTGFSYTSHYGAFAKLFGLLFLLKNHKKILTELSFKDAMHNFVLGCKKYKDY